jgi:hypothetical protein
MPDAPAQAAQNPQAGDASAPETAKPAGIALRDAALQLPSIVAQALLKRPVVLHGVPLGAFGFDTLLILSTIGNPLGGKSALNVQRTAAEIDERSIMQAVFALAEPDSATELAAVPETDGLTEYDRAAMRFCRRSEITPAKMRDFSAVLAKLYVEGLSAAPGAGGENPPPPAAA